jgi:endonuclease/exonuclease/phosphatase family metal-dependent hydrolase
VRVLTWNLFHGRTVPPSGRSMLPEFGAALAGWDWDVALLQETPPWWPPALAAAAGAQQRTVLTSRNWLLPVRRAISSRNPDLLKSNGGGCDAILVRGAAIQEHRTQLLTRAPERRMAHGVRLGDGRWVVNVHTTHETKPKPDAKSEAEKRPQSWADCRRAADAAHRWAGAAPLVFGGDLNLHGRPELPGLRRVAGHFVDHIFVGPGIEAVDGGHVLDRGILSDHAPVAVELRP